MKWNLEKKLPFIFSADVREKNAEKVSSCDVPESSSTASTLGDFVPSVIRRGKRKRGETSSPILLLIFSGIA